MNILSFCEEPNILRALLILKYALQIIFVLIPIILMIMVIIDLSKIIMNPKTEEVSGSLSKIAKRTVAAIAVFLLPTIISYTFEALITNYDNELKVCYENASLERIDILLKEQEQKRATEKEEEQKKLQEALAQRKEKEDKIREEIKKNREEEEKKNEQNNNVDGGAGTNLAQVAEPELLVNDEFKVSKQRISIANYKSFNNSTISILSNNGTPLDASNYTFESSNKGVVSVTKDGVLKPHFGGIARITITSKENPSKQASANVMVIQTLYTNVKVKSTVNGTSRITGNNVTINAGTEGAYNGVGSSNIRGYPYGNTIKIGNDYIQINNNSVTPVSYYIAGAYGKEYAEDFVNTFGFNSKTNYLFWTSHGTQTEYMFEGSAGHWKLIREFPVSTGDPLRNGNGAGTGVHFNSYTIGRLANEGYSVPVIWKNNGGGGSNPWHIGGGNNYPASHGCTRYNTEDLKWLVSMHSQIVDSRIIDF